MLDVCLAEPGVLKPSAAVGAGVVEPAFGLDQHVQAHQQSERVLASLVVDDGVVDYQRAIVSEKACSAVVLSTVPSGLIFVRSSVCQADGVDGAALPGVPERAGDAWWPPLHPASTRDMSTTTAAAVRVRDSRSHTGMKSIIAR